MNKIHNVLKKHKSVDLLKLQAIIKKETKRKSISHRMNLENMECSKCGSKLGLTRHHVSYNSNKVVVLCRICHNEIHKVKK